MSLYGEAVLSEQSPFTIIEEKDFGETLWTDLEIDHAYTKKQRTWGLMARESLPPSYGLLFRFPHRAILSFWSFNCYVDLSVAFLSDAREILEIKKLIAHPEKMDPARPVHSVEDIGLYSSQDEIYRFFIKNGIQSTESVRFAIEVRDGFFEENGIEKGDVLVWNGFSKDAYIIHTIDTKSVDDFTALHHVSEYLLAFRPSANQAVLFLDDENVLQELFLGEGRTVVPQEKPEYTLVVPKDWPDQNSVSLGKKVAWQEQEWITNRGMR